MFSPLEKLMYHVITYKKEVKREKCYKLRFSYEENTINISEYCMDITLKFSHMFSLEGPMYGTQ